MDRTITMVWPSVDGLMGVVPSTGKSVKLKPFTRQWMYTDQAEKAQAEGTVQIMVGLTPADLKQPADVAPVVKTESKSVHKRKKAQKKAKVKANDMLD